MVTFYQLILLALIIILPLIPKQLNPPIPFSIMLFAILLLPFIVVNREALVSDFRKEWRERNFTSLFFLFLLLFMTISTYFSIDRALSIQQLLLYCSFFVVFVSSKRIFSSFESKKVFATVFVAVSVLLSIISLYNTLIQRLVNREAEGVSFMWIYYGHNHLSALLIFSIPLSIYFILELSKKRLFSIILWFALYIQIISFFFTFGVGSIISLAFSVFITTFLFSGVLNKRMSFFIRSTIILLLIFSLLHIAYISRGDIKFYKNTTRTVQARLVYWDQAINNFLQRPFIGFGPNTFQVTDKEKLRKYRVIGSCYVLNFSLQMLSDLGIFGFITSIGIIASIAYHGFQKIRKTIDINEKLLYLSIWVGLFGSIINNLADFDWQLPTIFFVFWIIAGLL